MLRDFPLVRGRMAAVDPVRVPVPVRDAATVMLVRPAVSATAGVEVFTLRRMPRMAFAAGMLVFPGGAVEPGDRDARLPWHGPAPAAFAADLSTDEELARALVAAAVRETFEECGVLLAGPPDGAAAEVGPGWPLGTDPVWEARRIALLAGELTLADLLLDAGLVLRADLLHPWAHWITPPWEARRFDTRFFVAALPAGQQARYLAGEAAEAAWRDPGRAVRDHHDAVLPMLPPTLVTLEELAAATSVAQLLSAPRRLRPVSPWAVQLDGGDDDGGDDGGGDGGGRFVLRVDLDGMGGGAPGPSAVSP